MKKKLCGATKASPSQAAQTFQALDIFYNLVLRTNRKKETNTREVLITPIPTVVLKSHLMSKTQKPDPVAVETATHRQTTTVRTTARK